MKAVSRYYSLCRRESYPRVGVCSWLPDKHEKISNIQIKLTYVEIKLILNGLAEDIRELSGRSVH